MVSFDVHEVVLHLVAGIGAVVTTSVTSVLGLVRRRPVWLYVAALCTLGPSLYIAGLLPDILIALGILVPPVLCIASGMMLKYGNTRVAVLLMTPVYLMLCMLVLMYVYAWAFQS